MAFRFTLAQVLRVRESVERREELALQKAELEVARVQRQIEELNNRLAKTAEERETALRDSVRAIELQGINAEMNMAVEVRQAFLVTLQTLMQQRDAQRKIYQAAHSARQMLTDLSVQHRNEYENEQNRAQQKRLDDIFVARIQRD